MSLNDICRIDLHADHSIPNRSIGRALRISEVDFVDRLNSLSSCDLPQDAGRLTELVLRNSQGGWHTLAPSLGARGGTNNKVEQSIRTA